MKSLGRKRLEKRSADLGRRYRDIEVEDIVVVVLDVLLMSLLVASAANAIPSRPTSKTRKAKSKEPSKNRQEITNKSKVFKVMISCFESRVIGAQYRSRERLIEVKLGSQVQRPTSYRNSSNVAPWN